MLVLGVTGPIFSGTTTVAQRLAQLCVQTELIFANIFSTSALLTRIGSLTGTPTPTQSQKHEINVMLNKYHSCPHGIVNASWPIVQTNTVDLIVIDCVRNEAQILRWRELAGNDYFKLLYVDTNDHKRLTIAKTKAGRAMTLARFHKEERRSESNNLQRLHRQADMTIDNHGSLEDLDNQLENLIRQLAVMIKAPPT
jgi:dephospho-CoA kinase